MRRGPWRKIAGARAVKICVENQIFEVETD